MKSCSLTMALTSPGCNSLRRGICEILGLPTIDNRQAFFPKGKTLFFAPNEGLRRMESIDWKAGWNRFPGLGRFCKPASLFFSDADPTHALGSFQLAVRSNGFLRRDQCQSIRLLQLSATRPIAAITVSTEGVSQSGGYSLARRAQSRP